MDAALRQLQDALHQRQAKAVALGGVRGIALKFIKNVLHGFF